MTAILPPGTRARAGARTRGAGSTGTPGGRDVAVERVVVGRFANRPYRGVGVRRCGCGEPGRVLEDRRFGPRG